jgi:hypothetical protein
MIKLWKMTINGRRLAVERGERRRMWPGILWDLAYITWWRGIIWPLVDLFQRGPS